MSPHPRYNSRVLAFLSRQFATLRDRTQEFVRHTKMVSRWTAEAALYPFYRLVQTQKRLGQRVKQTLQTLSQTLTSTKDQSEVLAAGADSSAPIQKILEAIELVQQPVLTKSHTSDGSTNIIVTIHPRKPLPTLISTGTKALRRIKQFFLLPSAPPPSNNALATSQSRVIEQSQLGRFTWVQKGISAFRQVQRLFKPSPATQTLKAPAGLTHSTQLAHSGKNTLRIQGIASLLESHTLVLVTPEQDILDILSPAQQMHLSRRMMQELSRLRWAARKNRLTRSVAHLFHQLKASGTTPLLKPFLETTSTLATQTVPLWNNVKRWVIHSVIGALATLPIVAIPAIAGENNPPQLPTPDSAVSALWVDPNHLKRPVFLEQLSGFVSGQSQGQTGLRHFPQKTQAFNPTSQAVQPHSLNEHPTTNREFHTEILVDAEFLGYEPHLLENILSWLDTLMVRLESSLTILWTWIGMFTILCLSSLQKLRQLIPD